jgi:polysaccharide biosynthesis/export protein
MRRKITFVAAVVLINAGMIGAAQQGTRSTAKEQTLATARPGPAALKAEPVSAIADPTAYLIGPEDVLDISVWKEPDVSRVVPVRPDGRISLPLVSDVPAAGLSPQQLAANLAERLRKYFNDPQVTVIVTAINSKRVFVVGEVLRAGAFPLLPGMTVLQALSSAGGFTTYANVKKIHVVRLSNGKHIEYPFNYREVLKGTNREQNIKLEPGDTVIVP